MGDLTVCSLFEAQKHKHDFDAVITLEDPGQQDLLRFSASPHPSHLILAFHDLDAPSLGRRLVDRHQVEQALQFARLHAGKRIMIHCHAGISRSPSILLAILADRMGSGNEQEAMDTTLSIAPQAAPNRLIVKITDDILGCDGRLVDVVENFYDQEAKRGLILLEQMFPLKETG